MDDRPGSSLNWAKTLGWVLTMVALFFVGRWVWQVDRDVWAKLTQADLWQLALSITIFQSWFWLRFVGWDFISRRFGLNDQRRSNIKMWTLSELMRYIPGNVWSFAARYQGARQRGSTASGAISSLVLEAIFLGSGAALVSAFFWRISWWWLWLIGAAILCWLIPQVMKVIGRWRRWAGVASLQITDAVRLLILYSLVWSIYGLAQTIMIFSIPDIEVPAFNVLVGVNVLAWFVGYVSIITPMGLGVREVAFVSLLKNTAAAIGSLLAVVTRIWLIISELVFLGMVMMIPKKK